MLLTSLRNFRGWLAELGPLQKFLVLSVLDMLVVAVSLWGALALRLGTYVPSTLLHRGWVLLLVMPIAGVVVFRIAGLYRIVVRSLGRDAAWRAARASAVLALILAAVAHLDQSLFIPRSTPLIFGLLVFSLLLAARLAVKDIYNLVRRRGARSKPVLIYGAGASGTQLAASLEAAPEFTVVGFLDDDPKLWKRLIAGRPVSPPNEIDRLIARSGVEDVLLAVPSVSRSRRKEIVRFLSDRKVRVQTIPSMVELVAGFADIDKLRDVGVDELLGRDAVDPMAELFDAVRGRAVLVTGAGGSIGSELCRQAATNGARVLVLYELSEFALYKIEAELLAGPASGDTEIVAVLGSVGDEDLLCSVLARHRIDILYHAAAYKHVPLVEANPIEGVRNNTLGTRSVARAAIRAGVARAVLISTDKAVRPTSVMGASKRLAERVFLSAQKVSPATTFSTVRFGNVMGSSGSVIPLFQRQIEAGGPVTVTHPEITRYFMTIPEAAQLVIQASSMGTGGDVFLLDMGEPVRILELAHRMVHLAGAEVRDEQHPSGEIEVKITGLRPGEKLFEELLVHAEATSTQHPKIFRAVDAGDADVQVEVALKEIEIAVKENNKEKVIEILCRTVEGFVMREV